MLLAVLSFAPMAWAADNQPLRFGVVPQGTPSELLAKWGPVLAWLSDKSGVPLVFETANDIQIFEQRVAASAYDIAYMNPNDFIVFNRKPGYKALARNKGELIQGILVVRADSPIKTMADLQGATIAFPAPGSFAATIVVEDQLNKAGVTFQESFVKSHNSVYRAVAKGLYPAGGGVPHTLNMMEPEIRDSLRIIWYSQKFTPHAIATRPDVSEAVRQRLWKAMALMTDDSEGRVLLEKIGFAGFEKSKDSDWNDVRQLNMRGEPGRTTRKGSGL